MPATYGPAKDLLTRYLEGQPDDRADAEALLDEAETETERLEAESAPPTADLTAAEPTPTEPEPTPPAPEPGADRPDHSKLFIAGTVTTALAIVPVGLLATGAVMTNQAEKDFHAGPTLADRQDAESRGQTGDMLIVTGAVGAGVLAVAGVTMMLIGRRQEQKVAVTPVITPRIAGLGVGGRF